MFSDYLRRGSATNKFFSILFSIVLVIGLMPMTALGTEGEALDQQEAQTASTQATSTASTAVKSSDSEATVGGEEEQNSDATQASDSEASSGVQDVSSEAATESAATESGIALMSEEGEGGISPQSGGDNVTVLWKTPSSPEEDTSGISQPSTVDINATYQMHVIADFSEPANAGKTRTVSVKVPYGYQIKEITGATTTCQGQTAATGVTFINTTDAQAAITDDVSIEGRNGNAFHNQIADSNYFDNSGVVTYEFKDGTEQVNIFVTLIPVAPGIDHTSDKNLLADTVETNPTTVSGVSNPYPDIEVTQVSGAVTTNKKFTTISSRAGQTVLVYSSLGTNAVPTAGGMSGVFVGSSDPRQGYDNSAYPTQVALAAKGDAYLITTIPTGCEVVTAPTATIQSVTVSGATVPNSTIAAGYTTTGVTVITTKLDNLVQLQNYQSYNDGLSLQFFGVPGDSRTITHEIFVKPYSEEDPGATVNTTSAMNVGGMYLYAKGSYTRTLTKEEKTVALAAANGMTYDYISDDPDFPFTQALGEFRLYNSGNTALDSGTLHSNVTFDNNLGVKGFYARSGTPTNIQVTTSAGRVLTVPDGTISINKDNVLGLADDEFIKAIDFDTDQSTLEISSGVSKNTSFSYWGNVLNGSQDAVATYTVTAPEDPSFTTLSKEAHTTPSPGFEISHSYTTKTGTGATYHPGDSIPVTGYVTKIGDSGPINESTIVNPTFYLRVPYLDEDGNQLFDLDTVTPITGTSTWCGSNTFSSEYEGIQNATIDGKSYVCKIYKITTDTTADNPYAWEVNRATSNQGGSSSGTISFNLTAFSDNPATKNWKTEDMLWLDGNVLGFNNGGVSDPTGLQQGHTVMPLKGQILMSPLPELSVAAGIKLIEDTVNGYRTWDTTYGSIVQIPYNHVSEIQMTWANNSPTSFGKGTVIYLPIPHKSQTYTNYFTGTNTTNKTEVNAMFDSELDLNLTGPITLDKFDVEYAVSPVASNSFWDGSTTWTPVTGTWTSASGVSDWSKVVMVRFTAKETLVSGASGKTTFQTTMGSDAASGDQAYIRPLSKGVTNEETNSGTWVVGGIMAVEAQTSTLDGFVFDDNNANGTFDKDMESKDTTAVTLSISGTVKEKNSDGFPEGYVEGDKNTYTGKTTNTETDVDFGPTTITISSDGTYYVNDPNCPLAATGNIKYLPVGTYTLTSTIGDTDSNIYTTTGSSVITRTNTTTDNNAMDFNKLTGTNGVWKSDVTKDGTDAAIATYDFTVDRHATTNTIAGIGLLPSVTITYLKGDHGTINPDPASETLTSGSNPSANKVPTVTPDTGWAHDGWTLDKGVKATEALTIGSTTYNVGDTIPAGAVIPKDKITSIVVTEDINATAHYVKDDSSRITTVKTFMGKVDGNDVDPTAEIAAGDTVRYKLTVTNNTGSDKTNVTVTENPTNLTITSVTGTGVAWASPTITIASLAKDASVDITVDATVDAAGEFKNGVTTGGNTGTFTMDKQLVNATGELFTGDIYQGDTVYYKLVMANGSEANAGETITDTMIGMSGNAEKVSGTGTFNATTGEWSTGAVAANSSVSIIIKAQVASDVRSITNTITNPHADPVIITDPVKERSGSVEKTLKSVTKDGAIGGTAVYEVTVTNTGTSVMNGYKVIENPTGLAIDSVTGTDVSWDAGTKTITFNNVAANNGTKTATVTCTINADPFKNKVEPGSKTGDYTITKTRVTDKTGATEATGKVLNGQTVFYKLELSNGATPIDAAGIDITDTATNLSDGKYAADESAFSGTWNTGAVAANAKASVVVMYTVDDTCTYVSNAITAPNGETDIITTPVDPTMKDVTVKKELVTTGVIHKGDTVKYDITITNPNNDPVNVAIAGTLSGLSNVAVDSVNPTSATAQLSGTGDGMRVLGCPKGDTVVTISAKVTAAEFSNGITTPYKTDFKLDKQRVNADGSAATDTVMNGDTVYYKLSVENTGEIDFAAGKEVADAFDGLTYVGVEGAEVGKVETNGSKWTTPAVAKGATASVILKFTVTDAATLATNTATCENQSKVVTTPIDTSKSEVTFEKTLDTPAPIAKGDEVTYTITATNNSATALTNVKATEVPVGLTITGVTGTDVTWADPTITFASIAANGGTATATVTAKVTADEFSNGVTSTITIPGKDFTLDKKRVNADGSAATGKVIPSDTVYYELSLKNNSKTDKLAAGEEVADTFAGLTYVGTEGTVTGTVEDDGSKWTAPEIAADATAKVILKFTVNADSEMITNTATCEGQTVVVTTPVDRSQKDVTATKKLNTTGEIAVGDTVEYTITVTNPNADALTNVKLNETLTNLSDLKVTAPATGVTYTNGQLVFASLAAGDTEVTVIAKVEALDFTNSVDNPVPPKTDELFKLNKIRTDKDGNAATDTIINGSDVYYKLSIENTGDKDLAAGKEVADTADGLTYVDAAGAGSFDGSAWTAPAIAKGATESIILHYTVDATATIATNTATIEGQTVVVTTPVDRSQKGVTATKKLNTTGEIKVGDTVEYTITVTNPNADALINVKLNETLTGLSGLKVTAPTTGVTYANGQLVFASLAAGDTEVTVTAKVEDKNFTNSVDNPVPPTPNEAFVLDKVRVDAEGNAVAADAKVYVGETVYYKLSIESIGTDAVPAGKEVADTFSGMSYEGTEGTPGGTVESDGSKWTTPEVAVGTTESAILKFKVDFDSTIVTNTATCEGQTKVVTTGVEPSQKDVDVDKTLTTTGVITVGDTVSYDISVINSGTVTLTNVKVDENPEGLSDITIIEPMTGVAYTNNQIVLDELPVGTTTVKVTAKVTAEKFSNGVANPIYDPKNDVSIEKERVNADGSAIAADSKLLVGQKAYYKLTATNTGEADIAAGKEVTDVAQGMAFAGVVSGEGVSADGSTWTLPAIAMGDSVEVVLSYTVNADATQATNKATVDGKTITVSEVVYPDYSLVKSDKKLTTEGTIYYGNQVAYKITVTNTGERDLTNVVVRENSTGLESVTMAPVAGAAWSDADSTITIDSLAVGQTMTFSITATVIATSFSNGVAVDKPNPPLNTPDPVLSKQRVTDMTGTTPATDTPIHGATVYYKLTLANNGDKATDPMVVEDEFVNMVWANQTQGDGTIDSLTDAGFSWNVPVVEPDGSASIVYAMTVNQDASSITNSAVAEGLTPVVVTDLVDSGADIRVTKVADNAKPKPGDSITYTITVINNGTGTSNTVWVKDYVPANTTFVSCDATGTYGSSNGKDYVNWYPKAIPAGESVTLTMTVKVNEGVANGTAINNTALWQETEGEPDPTTDPIGGKTSNTASSTVSNPTAKALSTVSARSAKTGDNALPFALALGGIIAAGCVAFVARRRRDDSK